MGISILKQPYLVQKEILEQMGYMELFDLTFMSRPLKYTAHSLHIPCSIFGWRVGCPGTSINITLKDLNQRNVKIAFKIDKVPATTMRKFVNFKRKLPIKRSGKQFVLKCGKDDSENVLILEDLTQHLLNILRVDDFLLASRLNLSGTNIFETTQKFASLKLMNQDLAEDETRKILESLEVDDLHLSFTGPKIRDGPKDFELKHPIMELGNVDWLSIQSILAAKCERLLLGRVNHITQKDFSDIVRTWANGGFENLQELKLQVPWTWELSDVRDSYVYRDDVYKSFADMDVTITHASRDGDQKTIRRNSDGKRAQITFMKTFHFVVLP
ncbi:Protein CBG27606 [Caenorhabditis briggsae]|uniref:F-box associated domain-containing protein n=2 Tax=Caenorhabditis briggsae TaxID=6238 RepID=A0AAE9CUZ8_CAEBR|nr:Protein CBG27606 [Caenorhabditis briggsae]ULT81433.1 hypothetical protein L3Y34_011381 [Caenorhabditis briggsae]CAS00406.1 Protein CBG27606 [Caenorhabditis briggsae]